MEEQKTNKISESEPRPENVSGGVSFAQIAHEKEARKRPGQALDALYLKRKGDIAHIIIGTILLVIACAFLALSWRYNALKERVFTPVSLSFITSCVCYAASLAFGVWGIVGVVRRTIKIRAIHAEDEKYGK